MNENYKDCHHPTKRARFYIQKHQKICEIVLYTKSQTLFKKLDNFRYVFIYNKPYTLRYRIFHEIFDVGIYIQKARDFALRDIFIYKKLDTSQKARQFAIRFYIQKSGTLRYAIFH